MKRRFTAVLASLFLLSGCHTGEQAPPEEMPLAFRPRGGKLAKPAIR